MANTCRYISSLNKISFFIPDPINTIRSPPYLTNSGTEKEIQGSFKKRVFFSTPFYRKWWRINIINMSVNNRQRFSDKEFQCRILITQIVQTEFWEGHRTIHKLFKWYWWKKYTDVVRISSSNLNKNKFCVLDQFIS